MDRDVASPAAQPREPIALYIHIPKTAGSTLLSVLSRNYPSGSSVRLEGPALMHKSREASEICAKLKPRLVYGHHPFGLHVTLDRPWLYFTLLRHPVERLVSEYRYAFQYDQHRFVEEIRSGQLTLEKFLMLDHWFTGNIFTGYISGLRAIGNGARLETAKLNLRERFASFGVMEQFSDSVLLMASELGWEHPLYVKRNVTERRHDEISRELYARVEKKLEVDMELYEYACSLLRERIDRQPDSFHAARQEYLSKISELGDRFSDRIHRNYQVGHGDDLKIGRFEEMIPITRAYLQETSRTRSHPRSLRGVVEEVSLRSASGWSLEAGDQDLPVDVLVEVDGGAPLRARAERKRQDPLRHGPYSPDLGFALDFDPILDQALPHTLSFRHAETGWLLDRGEWRYDPGKGWRCVKKSGYTEPAR